VSWSALTWLSLERFQKTWLPHDLDVLRRAPSSGDHHDGRSTGLRIHQRRRAMRSGTFKAVLYWRHRMLLEPGTNGALLTPVHQRRSFRIVSIRTGACKNLQAVPEYASGTGCERPRRGTADPDFPGSAAICCRCLPPVTPEAAGSSPVDPANSFAHAHSLAARRPQASRRSRGAWHESRRPRQL
jgi:hypothetical protein